MDKKTDRYVTLPRGRRLSWLDARKVVDKYLKEHSAAFDLYDGTNKRPHDNILEVDLLALNALNAFVGAAPMTPMEALWKNRTAIQRLVAKITTTPVEDLSDMMVEAELPKVVAALKEIEKTKWFGGAGTRAAKLLHRLRPNIVPIWDALVGEWYRGASQPWREYLRAVYEDVRRPENRRFLKSLRLPTSGKVSILRLWDILLWKMKYDEMEQLHG